MHALLDRVLQRRSPVGPTPLIEGTGHQFKRERDPGISNRPLAGSVFKGRFAAAVLIDLLHRPIGQARGQKIILILDGIPFTPQRSFATATHDQISPEFRPAKAPSSTRPSCSTRVQGPTRSAAVPRPQQLIGVLLWLRHTQQGP
jgi:hypothetical protein